MSIKQTNKNISDTLVTKIVKACINVSATRLQEQSLVMVRVHLWSWQPTCRIRRNMSAVFDPQCGVVCFCRKQFNWWSVELDEHEVANGGDLQRISFCRMRLMHATESSLTLCA